jgi:hypothetical protein
MTPPFLVQQRDRDGFWVNLSEQQDHAFACRVAQHEANETGRQTRVVSGPERRSPQYFDPERAKAATR